MQLHKKLALLILLLVLFPACGTDQIPMVIVIPSYNNAQWYEKNLSSILNQEYDNYRVIYIDDCSSDQTYQLVKIFLENHPQGHRVTLFHNDNRCGALYNLYHAIYSCDDRSVIVTVDGDDWLAHNQVLLRVNQEYQNPNVWLTYGNFIRWPMQARSFCAIVPPEVIMRNAFRDHPWVTSHLRTFYVGLFKKINYEDLLYQGAFCPVAWDMAMMFPMLEMCGDRFKFIPDVLYTYNYETPINDMKIHYDVVKKVDMLIRSKQRYKKLNRLFE